MFEKVFLGIDQGSSATKAVLLDQHGQHYQEFSVPVNTHSIDAVTIEQDPRELLSTVRMVANDAIRAAARLRKHIAGIGFSFQRSGVLAWDGNSGDVLHPLISHRDQRTRAQLEALHESHALIAERTGLPPLPNYAAAKIALLQKQFPDPQVLISTLDSFVVQQFAGDSRFITEDSMAARTMLYSLAGGGWDDELCQLFGVQSSRLPSISSSLAQHGTYRGIPVMAMLGDQQASLFSRLAEGVQCILNLGTGSWVSIYTEESPVQIEGLVTGILYSEGTVQREFKYLIEAVTACSGAVLEFVISKLKVASNVAELDSLCRTVPDSECPVAFFPAGLTGSFDWRSDLPALVSDRSATPAALARALVENIGNFVAQNIQKLSELELLKPQHQPIPVSGGLSDSDFLIQHIADVSGYELARVGSREASARGAAIACMQTLNRNRSRVSLPKPHEKKIFRPTQSSARGRFEKWAAFRSQALSGSVPIDLLLKAPEEG